MKDRPFIGLMIADAINRPLWKFFYRRGWRESVIPFIGYGNTDHVRVLARLVLRPSSTSIVQYADRFLNQRGWRNFFTVPCPHQSVTITLDNRPITIQTDRDGYVDVLIEATDLEPGWQKVQIESAESDPVWADVEIVSPDVKFGIISDIDDTIITTWLPRPMLAAWNSFVLTEGNRQAVPGMARMYQKLLAANPGAPIIYLSTGAWNTLPFLNRFLARHGFPKGVFLMTDWGPTNTGWFRSGQEHKRSALRALARDFPNIKWLLVGDNGQHDPVLFREFADYQAKHIKAIAIRELSSAEQVLAHGTATVLTDVTELQWAPPSVPEISGPDGDALTIALQPILGTELKAD